MRQYLKLWFEVYWYFSVVVIYDRNQHLRGNGNDWNFEETEKWKDDEEKSIFELLMKACLMYQMNDINFT